MDAKPHGPAPFGKDGIPCHWDEMQGCWMESDGSPHKMSEAERKRAYRKRDAVAAASGDEKAKQRREAEAERSRRRRGQQLACPGLKGCHSRYTPCASGVTIGDASEVCVD
jgi:hypothetical protein